MSRKITDLVELTESSLTDDDVFHIIDTSESNEIIGSRQLKYGTLRDALSKQIGLNSLLSTWIENKELHFLYELKNGQTRDITINLSSIVNIYEGDGTYLSVDDSTCQIRLIPENVSKYQTLSGYGINDVSGQLSIDWTKVAKKSHTHVTSEITDFENQVSVYEKRDNLGTAAYTQISDYALVSHRHGLEDIDEISSISAMAVKDIRDNELPKYQPKGDYLSSSNSFLSSNALEGLSDDWKYETAKSNLSNEGYLISDYTKLALSSIEDIVGYNISVYNGKLSVNIEKTGSYVIFREWN